MFGSFVIQLVIMTKGKNPKSKANKITPTTRQRIAFDRLVELGGKYNGKKSVIMGKILAEAGYSKITQKTPTKVTQSKGWLQLMEEHFPDDKLSKKMDEQLDAKTIDHYTFSVKTPDEEINTLIEDFGFKVMKITTTGNTKRAYYSAPDHQSRDKMIEKILKLKRKYPAEKHEHLIAEVKIIKYE